MIKWYHIVLLAAMAAAFFFGLALVLKDLCEYS